MPHPDFQDRLLPVLQCRGIPDRVPLVEAGIALPIKEQFLGRPLTTLEDEIDFWSRAGFDFLPLEAGLRTIIDAAIHHAGTGRFEEEDDAEIVRQAKQFGRDALSRQALSTAMADGGTRTWAPEGKGMITSLEDFEAFPWPTADDLNYRIFQEV
jgi:uroporphyrinogen decarboxylase